MRIALCACMSKQAQTPPMVNIPGGLINMDTFLQRRRKDKVVIVMGATGTGKSRLSIDLATRFPAEIINSDKMQVYKGLDIATNKVTEEECYGVPHHMLGFVDPDEDFTAADFRHHASLTVESILRRDRLPIIAGGSNSYIKALVTDDLDFKSRYDCCFLWVDVAMPVLHSFVSKRVDRMLESGLVEEVRRFYKPGSEPNYSRGIRRAIGVPELDQYFRAESVSDDKTRAELLEQAIDKIKVNNCKLACCQLQNILRLKHHLGRDMHHLDATEAFIRSRSESDEAWEKLVAGPSSLIVNYFLCDKDFMSAFAGASPPSPVIIGGAAAAVAAATH